MKSYSAKFLVLCLFSLVCPMESYAQVSLSKLFESSLPSIIKIETFDSNNIPLMSGTGFFISANGMAISNLHVFRGSSKSQITTSSGKIYQIDKVWYKNDSLDLVKFDLLDESKEIFPFLQIAKNIPKVGDAVFSIGNPIGLDFSITNGIISAIRQSESGQIIQTNAPVSPGSSGSPLIDMNGMVLGVVTFSITEGQNLNFAISMIDKNLTKDFVKLNTKLLENIRVAERDNSNEKYSLVRGHHAAMCADWRFTIDYLRNMSNGEGFEWAIKTFSKGKFTPLESYVISYHDNNIIGITALFVVDKNLSYVVSFGTGPSEKVAILMASKISNGEAHIIFNYIVEKVRVNSDNNLFLEEVGNAKISLVIEDRMYVRNIYLDDTQGLKLYHINPYLIN